MNRILAVNRSVLVHRFSCQPRLLIALCVSCDAAFDVRCRSKLVFPCQRLKDLQISLQRPSLLLMQEQKAVYTTTQTNNPFRYIE